MKNVHIHYNGSNHSPRAQITSLDLARMLNRNHIEVMDVIEEDLAEYDLFTEDSYIDGDNGDVQRRYYTMGMDGFTQLFLRLLGEGVHLMYGDVMAEFDQQQFLLDHGYYGETAA